MADTKRIKLLINWLISQGIISSQQELGEKFGITSKSYLSQLVNGRAYSEDFINKLSEFDGRINREWLETGEGSMIISEGGGQTFHGDINGGNNKFSGRDMTINPPCTLGFDIDKVFNEISAQRKLTEEAQAQTRKAQEQMDRLLTIIENLNRK